MGDKRREKREKKTLESSPPHTPTLLFSVGRGSERERNVARGEYKEALKGHHRIPLYPAQTIREPPSGHCPSPPQQPSPLGHPCSTHCLAWPAGGVSGSLVCLPWGSIRGVSWSGRGPSVGASGGEGHDSSLDRPIQPPSFPSTS